MDKRDQKHPPHGCFAILVAFDIIIIQGSSREVNMAMRKGSVRLYIDLSKVESEWLERYCEETGRSRTDVIRELVRSLKPQSSELTQQSA